MHRPVQSRTIRSVGIQRIETIHDPHDSSAMPNVRTRDPCRIPFAVPVLVMMSDDRYDWIWEANRRQQVCSDRGMPLHRLEFGSCELAWLVQDVLRNREFAHVVEQCCGFDRFQLSVVVDTQSL